MEELKKLAEVINTKWGYYLDVDGDDSDVFIHFFKCTDWVSSGFKVKPIVDDIMRYAIIIPLSPILGPPDGDWSNLFIDGCMISSSSKKKVGLLLDEWGFIDISKVKEISSKEERLLCS